jgi:hypothetical protein
MVNFNDKNPNVILVPNPVDLDRAIARVQTQLGNLTWLEKVFGRAKVIPHKNGLSRDIRILFSNAK